MERIGGEIFAHSATGGEQSGAGGRYGAQCAGGGGLSSPSPGTSRGTSLLQPRVNSSLWQMSLAFESDETCDLVSQHIELRRIQIRHERLCLFKSILEVWADSANEEPVDSTVM